ncbi:MAG: response regulator [Desulfobacteraceae bacterium]|nr:response regulator [Desulfobacteraceae bacterium]
MKKILIVDDNAETRNSLLAELRAYNEFMVLSADSAKIAATFFKTQRIDLLITELNLPEINGFKLLSYIKKYSPDTHAIAITRVFSSQIIEKLKSIGVFSYLTKPVNINSLIDLIFEQFDNPSGSIHGITLASFLQLMHIEQKTCTLTLSTNKNIGVIYCLDGETIGAQTGEFIGKAAFYKIMEWENPSIKIKEGCKNTVRQIDVPLMHLLMESHQAMDELGGDDSEAIENGKDDEAENLNFHHEDLNYKKLESRLSETPGVSNYEIFNGNNIVLNETSPSNSVFKMSPLEYFSMGNEISSLVGGSLKYSTISQSDRSSYLIGKSNNYYIRAKLKPGTKVGDIIG